MPDPADTETLAEVRLTDDERDEIGAATIARGVRGAIEVIETILAARIVQARAGEAEVTNAEYDALRDAVGRDRDLDAVFSRVVDAVGVILSARAGEADVIAAQAEAWEEGFQDGRRQDAEGDDGPRFINPYRADRLATDTAAPVAVEGVEAVEPEIADYVDVLAASAELLLTDIRCLAARLSPVEPETSEPEGGESRD